MALLWISSAQLSVVLYFTVLLTQPDGRSRTALVNFCAHDGAPLPSTVMYSREHRFTDERNIQNATVGYTIFRFELPFRFMAHEGTISVTRITPFTCRCGGEHSLNHESVKGHMEPKPLPVPLSFPHLTCVIGAKHICVYTETRALSMIGFCECFALTEAPIPEGKLIFPNRRLSKKFVCQRYI